MSATHTPAPWECFYKHKYNEWHVTVPAKNSGCWRIGLFSDGVPGDTDEEREGNARLIAAAPDLLAACNEAIGIVADRAAGGRMLTRQEHANAVLSTLQSASAKAEGREVPE